MEYELFSYHGANTAPIGSTDKCIYGVELEINDRDASVEEVIENAIEHNIITAPSNNGETLNKKVIEYDSSVFCEIIINADTIERLNDRLNYLNDYGFNEENISNTPNTSCHIHMNRKYVCNVLRLSEEDIVKIFDFLAPILYRISGRDSNSFYNWTPSRISFELESNLIDWRERANRCEGLEYDNLRYAIINGNNSRTIELRLFSNYCNFDLEVIMMYLCIVDYILHELAGANLKTDYKEILYKFYNYLKTNYNWVFYEYNLPNVLFTPYNLQIIEDLKVINHSKLHINPRFKLSWFNNQNYYDNFISILRTARLEALKLPSEITTTDEGLKSLNGFIKYQFETNIRSYYMKAYEVLSSQGIFREVL